MADQEWRDCEFVDAICHCSTVMPCLAPASNHSPVETFVVVLQQSLPQMHLHSEDCSTTHTQCGLRADKMGPAAGILISRQRHAAGTPQDICTWVHARVKLTKSA